MFLTSDGRDFTGAVQVTLRDLFSFELFALEYSICMCPMNAYADTREAF